MRIDQVLAVMIAGGCVFVALDVDVIEQMEIMLEHDVGIQIQKLVRNLREQVCKKPDEGIGRAVGSLVGTAREVLHV